jgi:NAD(P)-dependent dehydrogenase (short-subunit alcohol dehydrogenase family)
LNNVLTFKQFILTTLINKLLFIAAHIGCDYFQISQEQVMSTNATKKIALITGGSRGLGKSSALNLARRGNDVILTYRNQESEAAAVVAEITGMGGKAVGLQLDVGESISFGDFAQKVRSALSTHWHREHFDYLVNNAGMGVHASFAETSEAQFDALMNVHLKGPFFLTQALLPLIADGGRIVNVSSGLARFSFPGYAAYAMMKGGIEVLTRYLAKELGSRGIAVNVIAPGAIATDFGGGLNPRVDEMIASFTALGRVGLPDDIGPLVASLLSEDNRWINGQRIEASGGIFL